MWPALLSAAGFALVLTALEPIIDGVAGSSILFFVSTTDEHDGDLWDSDYMLRDAISFAHVAPDQAGLYSATEEASTVLDISLPLQK